MAAKAGAPREEAPQQLFADIKGDGLKDLLGGDERTASNVAADADEHSQAERLFGIGNQPDFRRRGAGSG
ncbi:hypothetical protein ACFWBS_45775 [Streptomyces mirabilis]|uniref:hypothetical protein n=1 Tax=Streptomyces mirabilis TaxID=68239 RepID=UPI00365B3756